MLTKTNIETTTYDCPLLDNFKIDIVKNNDEVEAWIYHSKFGTKKLMFGMTLGSQGFHDDFNLTDEKFLEIIEGNALKYARFYIEDVMEGD